MSVSREHRCLVKPTSYVTRCIHILVLDVGYLSPVIYFMSASRDLVNIQSDCSNLSTDSIWKNFKNFLLILARYRYLLFIKVNGEMQNTDYTSIYKLYIKWNVVDR